MIKNIKLTTSQVEQLQEMNDRINALAKNGTPGLLIAQVLPESGEIIIELLKNDEAKKVTALMSQIHMMAVAQW